MVGLYLPLALLLRLSKTPTHRYRPPRARRGQEPKLTRPSRAVRSTGNVFLTSTSRPLTLRLLLPLDLLNASVPLLPALLPFQQARRFRRQRRYSGRSSRRTGPVWRPCRPRRGRPRGQSCSSVSEVALLPLLSPLPLSRHSLGPSGKIGPLPSAVCVSA
jgi:hypothetical protein